MKKIRNLVIGGIENKVFNLILFTMLIMGAAYFAISQYQSHMLARLSAETNAKQQEALSGISSDLMDQVVDKSMSNSCELEALIADDLFRDLGIRVTMMQEYAEKLFGEDSGSDSEKTAPEAKKGGNASTSQTASYEAPDPAKDGQITTQLILADSTDASDPDLKKDLETAACMSDMMTSLFSASPATNSCFIALPEGAFLVTDDRPAAKFDSNGTPVSYDPRIRPWYLQAVEEGGMFFSDVEFDSFTGDIGIVCAVPVYVDGTLRAVVGSDLFLTSMQEAIQSSDEDGGYLFIVNQYGHVVFSPKTEGLFRVTDSDEAYDLRESENAELASLVKDAMNGQTDVRVIDLEDGSFYMTGAPLETVNWALISVFSQEMAARPTQMMVDSTQEIQAEAISAYRGNIRKSKRNSQILILLLTVLLLASAIILGRRIVRPLNTITKRLSELNESNLEFRMEDTFKTGDEIEILAESFASLSHKTVQYVEQVKTVTAEKERINSELNMATQIQEGMLPNIFPAFPDHREFDIYATMDPAREVGGDFYDFFLTDDNHLAMVMADVSGKGVPAALFMMASKIILANNAMMGRTPAEVLRATNETICSNNKLEMFVTVWLGVLDLTTGVLVASNAGHEYPCLRHPGGLYELMKDKHGFVIGGLEGVKYDEYTIQLQPGDMLFLYTDGVPEATDSSDQLFGTRRMIDALNIDPDATPNNILKNVRHAVDEFVGNAEQFDDLTMLCLEYKGNS